MSQRQLMHNSVEIKSADSWDDINGANDGRICQ